MARDIDYDRWLESGSGGPDEPDATDEEDDSDLRPRCPRLIGSLRAYYDDPDGYDTDAAIFAKAPPVEDDLPW